MKKFALVPAVLLSVISFSNVLLADDSRIYFAPEVGYVLPTDGSVDDTVFVGGRLGYEFNANFALEAESGWASYGYDVSGGPQNVDVDSVPVMLNLRFNGTRCEGDKLGWYVFGGAGVTFNEVESNRSEIDFDNTFALQGGVGADYLVAEKTSVFLEARYLWNNPDVSSSNEALDDALDAVDAEVDLSSVIFMTGVKF